MLTSICFLSWLVGSRWSGLGKTACPGGQQWAGHLMSPGLIRGAALPGLPREGRADTPREVMLNFAEWPLHISFSHFVCILTPG